jgi:ubiquinone/menaquinone biosynthesis C-methylase UbiE
MRSDSSFLDLGAGAGNLVIRFSALCCDLCCADLSIPMLEKAYKKISAANIVVYDLRLPFPLNTTPFFRLKILFDSHENPFAGISSINNPSTTL